ncbi:lytic murein transglycosylase B [Marinomonas balearica]|uniref:Membrane-bound lytic murein transglycosylase B n=1 Tax=Marinomonas balearica TaxID=491947 RepID=A0A4R6MD99_9GAMM|nr:lytic murein transglycosylase B [Marinomonas balearica]TDO99668.1 membrane-bound lytic murein transglycosylase B [Marinomonas balearica]
MQKAAFWIFFVFVIASCSSAPTDALQQNENESKEPRSEKIVSLEKTNSNITHHYYLKSDVQRFVEYMSDKHSYDRTLLVKAFSSIQQRPQVIKKSNNQPEAITPYFEYRKRFVNQTRVDGGIAFANKYKPWLIAAQREYGVDWSIIVALIGVETAYGRITGSRDVFTSLTTLAFDYPRRSKYFKSELEAYLLLARKEGWGIGNTNGSYSGALGMVQFMPSNYMKLAVDFDKNGHVDLWGSPADAIGSAANYLRFHGWRPNKEWVVDADVMSVKSVASLANKGRKPVYALEKWETLGVYSKSISPDKAGLIKLRSGPDQVSYWLAFENFFTVMDYNPSRRYAMSVIELANRLKVNGL